MLTSDAIGQLLRSQLGEWPMAAGNYRALEGVRVKSLDVEGMPFRVQFNPARIVSSGAKVDAASVKARRCFLCGCNRPDCQKGLPWYGYTVLINPFPIFPRHFTIPADSHTDQRIDGRIADMMRLAQALEGYTVFYNGPRCGASAPDHMHFQTGNTDFLTLPDALAGCRLVRLCADGDSYMSVAHGLPMGVFVIDANDIAAGERLFRRLYDALPCQFAGEEPMMNLLCYATQESVRLAVIPRVKHRPSCYGADTPGSMLISPASVDVGGVFITPVEKDFEATDTGTIKSILSEVCMNPDQIASVVENMKL